MRLKPVWPMLALALSACAAKSPSPQPIPALAEERQCPAYPPPADLIKVPVKTDYLDPSIARKPR